MIRRRLELTEDDAALASDSPNIVHTGKFESTQLPSGRPKSNLQSTRDVSQVIPCPKLNGWMRLGIHASVSPYERAVSPLPGRSPGVGYLTALEVRWYGDCILVNSMTRRAEVGMPFAAARSLLLYFPRDLPPGASLWGLRTISLGQNETISRFNYTDAPPSTRPPQSRSRIARQDTGQDDVPDANKRSAT